MPALGIDLLELLGVAIIAATAVELLARKVRMPSIVSYLVAGLILGPALGWMSPEVVAHGTTELLGDIGIVLLMFLVGLELSLERIRQVGKVAVLAGLGQVAFTAAGGLGLCLLLGFDWMASVFLATALTFSSTVVVVKLLDQKGELDSLYGRIAVGIFLVQDLVVVVVLTLLAGLGQEAQTDGGDLAVNLAKAFAGMSVLLAGALVAARYVLPRPFAWAARAPRTLFVWSVAWCFGVVAIAEHMTLSAEIGAFLAGMSLAQLGCARDLRRRLHPVMSFFIVVFFVSLGAEMRFDAASAHWTEAVVLSLFVLIGNPLIFMVIITRSAYSERTAFLTSVTVAQISEFSFIFAAAGVSAGLIGDAVLSIVGLVGVVTIAASAYMILYNHQLYAWASARGWLRVFRAASTDDDEEAPPAPRSGHVVVIGMNELGRRLATALHERGETVVALDHDPRKLEGLPCDTQTGDVEYRASLEDAGVPTASLVVSCLRIESTNRGLVYRCRSLGVPVVVHAFEASTYETIRELEPDTLIEPKREAAARVAEWLREQELLQRVRGEESR